MEWIMARTTAPHEIVEFMNTAFELYEIRGKVGQENGISFVVHSNEQNHCIPHVHAEYGEYHISIAIKTCAILAGNLPSKQSRFAQGWVKCNETKLMNDWSSIALSATSHLTNSLISSADTKLR